MKTTPQSMKEEFEKLFKIEERDIVEHVHGTNLQLSLEQLWLITKFAKYVRLRARNNVAFNNLCNAVFPYAKFEQVNKTRADGSTYPGLRITIKDTPQQTIESEEEE